MLFLMFALTTEFPHPNTVSMSESKFTNAEQESGANRSLSGVNNALDVLELLARENRQMSLAEIATALSMSKAGAHRVLTTLANRGYVD